MFGAWENQISNNYCDRCRVMDLLEIGVNYQAQLERRPRALLPIVSPGVLERRRAIKNNAARAAHPKICRVSQRLCPSSQVCRYLEA